MEKGIAEKRNSPISDAGETIPAEESSIREEIEKLESLFQINSHALLESNERRPGGPPALDGLESELDAIRSDIERAMQDRQAHIQLLESRLRQAELNLRENSRKASRVSRKFKAFVRSRIRSLEESLAVARAHGRSSLNRTSELEHKVRVLLEDLDSMARARSTQIQEDSSRLRAMLQSREAELKSLHSSAQSEHERERESLRSSYALLKDSHDKTVARLNETIRERDALYADLTELRPSLEKLSENNSFLRSTKTLLETRLATLDSDYRRQVEELRGRETELLRLRIGHEQELREVKSDLYEKNLEIIKLELKLREVA